MKFTRIGATLGAIALTLALAGPALAGHVTPEPISDDNNPTCGDFGAWLEVKSDPPGNETIDVAGFGTITVSNFANNSFDWSSDFGIDAVLVKAGNDKHNLYTYVPESLGDTGLVPQDGQGNGISHISFCYDEDPEPTPTPTPTPTPEVTPTPTPEVTPTPTPEVTPTPTPEGSVGGETATPAITLPPTDALGDSAAPGTGAWAILLVIMAGIVASVLVLTPSRRR